AADLLLPRLDRVHGLRLLHLRRVAGVPAPLEARPARRPVELRLRAPGIDLRDARADRRLDLGQARVGPLVAVERGRARALPRAFPLLLRVLHAPLLGGQRAATREPERGL